jgi:glyoxylase-like metal-dependent hydrolase (beta-lactamase superfamily II)
MANASRWFRVGLGGVFFGAVGAVAVAQGPSSDPKLPALPKRPYEDPVRVAEGVWFEQHHDVPTYGSNVAWIEFADFVAVVDTAFPLGAERALKSIKRTTKGKRIRYAIVTHYHDDHSFGGGVFAKEGAIIVAHENARRHFVERGVSKYAEKAAKDKAYARSPAATPQLTFKDQLILDDGKGRRAELFYFGNAHTTGDVFTFLPKEKIVFTGDACVNGDHNYLGDADTASWIEVLRKVQALSPEIVVPGHGPVGKPDVLENQKVYFVELRKQLAELIKQGKGVEEAKKLVDIPSWKHWTGKTEMKPAAITHVYQELTRTAEPKGR